MLTITFHVNQEHSNSLTSFFGNDPYIERFWLSFIGPTATSLLKYLSIRALTDSPWFDCDLAELSRRMGTGNRTGTSSPISKQLTRLHRFGLIHCYNETSYLVSDSIPKLSSDQIYKLPRYEQVAHDSWIQEIEKSPLKTYRARINNLITTMSLMGEDNNSIALAISNTGFHPSIIGEYLNDIDNILGVA